MFKKIKLPKRPIYQFHCPKCGRHISASIICCPFCMESINSLEELANPYHCIYCRYDNSNDSYFCQNCGAPLTREAGEFLEILYGLDGLSEKKFNKFLSSLSPDDLIEFKVYLTTWLEILNRQG